MQISVLGKNDKLSKKEIRHLIKEFGGILVGTRMNIFIKVQHLNDLDAWGYCIPIDHNIYLPREFEILINPNLSKSNQVRTIAHEMVHVYQFSRGLLRQSTGEHYKWMGRKVNASGFEYEKIPWEVQAFIIEDELFSWYQKHLKRTHI